MILSDQYVKNIPNLTRALPSFLYKSAYWDEANEKPMVFHQLLGILRMVFITWKSGYYPEIS